MLVYIKKYSTNNINTNVNVTGYKVIYTEPLTFRIYDRICSCEINRGNISVNGSYGNKTWSFSSIYAPLQTITFLSIDGDCHIKITPDEEVFLKTVSETTKTVYLKANTTYIIS